ncbi:MAG: hypothetical protein ABIA62_06250 [Candidatus Woesearchaeota archaeon]
MRSITPRKILSIGLGILTASATLLGASAARYDLGDYPEPFVQDGVFNGMLVIGDDAAPADIIGITDIAMSLQFSAAVKETVRLSEGDARIEAYQNAVKTERSGDALELNEWLGDVVETLGAEDAEALKSFMVANDKGSSTVNQYLKLAWGPAALPADGAYAKVIHTKDEEGVVGDFLWFKDGEEAFQYELEFEEGFEADIEATGDSLTDMESETLHILGEDFTITRARWLPATKGLALELMGGSIHDLIEEGASRTYSIKGKEYEVTAFIVSDWLGATETSVKLKINGILTKELRAGSTETLPDGTVLGIREILPNEAGEIAGGDLVDMYLGAHKLELNDIYASGTWDGTVKIDGEGIDDAEMMMTYSNSSSSVRLERISYRLYTDSRTGDEPYIRPGDGLRDWLDEPQGFLAKDWDIRYMGLSRPVTSLISITNSGDDEYRFSFTNTQGIEHSAVKYLYSNSTGLYFGDDDDHMVFEMDLTAFTGGDVDADCTIHKNDYFIVGHNTHTDQGVSRVLRLDAIDTDENTIQMTDIGTGKEVISTFTELNGSSTGDTINVGGYRFDFAIWDGFGSGDEEYRLCVDLNDSNSLTGPHKAFIVTEGGAIIDIATDVTQSSYRQDIGSAITAQMTTKSSNFYEVASSDEDIDVILTRSSSGDLDLDGVSNSSNGFTFESPDDDQNTYYALSNYGVFVKESANSGNPDKMEIYYPTSQLLPQVFVTFDKTMIPEESLGTIEVLRPTRVKLGSAVLAKQMLDIDGQNIISVGGPCVNKVSAEIMGLSYPACGPESGIQEGEGLIKLYERGNNVAIIVAGWDADDTTRASRVLADYREQQIAGKLKGKSVLVTGTSVTQYTVKPVK